jgi:saccharopine dehydrogenase-like NADP-dependent oxidoreductase
VGTEIFLAPHIVFVIICYFIVGVEKQKLYYLEQKDWRLILMISIEKLKNLVSTLRNKVMSNNRQKNVLVLGAGQQGRTVVEELLRAGRNVTVADRFDYGRSDREIKAGRRTAKYQYFNAEDVPRYKPIFGAYFQKFDLVVGALPAEYAHPCVEVAAETKGVRFVDLSFTEEDLSKYNERAQKNKSLILADCGLAPGLSNLMVGDLQRRHVCKNLQTVKIYVGGVSRNKDKNKLGYTCTWSLDDLCSEYIRDARILVNGKEVVLPPPVIQTEDPEIIEIPGIGSMEAFPSDGVRSLLALKDQIPTIIEQTLRWPGHLREVQKLVSPMEEMKDCFFIDPLMDAFLGCYNYDENDISLPNVDDLVVLLVEGGGDQYILTDYGRHGKSAMSRTTAYTCATFAELVLAGRLKGSYGVKFPEHIGRSKSCFEFIMRRLNTYGISFIVKPCDGN